MVLRKQTRGDAIDEADGAGGADGADDGVEAR